MRNSHPGFVEVVPLHLTRQDVESESENFISLSLRLAAKTAAVCHSAGDSHSHFQNFYGRVYHIYCSYSKSKCQHLKTTLIFVLPNTRSPIKHRIQWEAKQKHFFFLQEAVNRGLFSGDLGMSNCARLLSLESGIKDKGKVL